MRMTEPYGAKIYVLDTHAFIWWASAPRKLGREARRVLAEVDEGRAFAWVPSIVGVELVLLAERGRKKVSVTDLEAATRRNRCVAVFPQDLAQAREFAHLEMLEDPFDRMIVAAARVAKRPLLTADERIADSGLVDVVWD